MKSFVKKLASYQLLIAFLSLPFCVASYGQGLQDSLKHDDDDIVSSIAPYPAGVRDAILDVSQYPQKLVKIERLQARTSQSFQDLVSAYPRETQEKFYDLARYPDLVNQLVSSDQTKSPEEIKSILSAYPKELAANVNDLYPSHIGDLQSMNRSYQQSQETLQSTIKSLPEQTQENFKKVISMPDVMSLLTDRIDLTVSLGEAYKSNPDEVRQSLETLNGQITAQNEKDLDDYKKQVQSDPALQEEMKKSSNEFANNYSETDDGSPQVVNNYYTSNPYPYWFGYPYWYPSPIWYPRPLYYHTGFYLGLGGNVVVVGLPSYAYSNWFFNYGYRSYPRLYGRYNTYYTNHRNYRSNINVYRGYNSAVHEHFNRVNNIRGNNNGRVNNGFNQGRETRNSQQGSRTTQQGSRTTQQGSRTTQQGSFNNNRGNITSGRSQNFRNSINYRGSNFNSQQQHLNNFHSQQYHQQSWHSVGGAGMQRSGGGGSRSYGGGGGGGRSGGGGGGRRGR